MPAHDASNDNLESPQHRVVLVMTLMRALHGVMSAENELLRQLRLDRLRELQAEKAALVEGYELALGQLCQAPERQAALTEAERDVLDLALRELPVAVRRHVERLTQARAAVDAVARAIDESLCTIGDGSALVPRPRLASGG